MLSREQHQERQRRALKFRRMGWSWAGVGSMLLNGKTGEAGVSPSTARQIAYHGVADELEDHFQSLGDRVGPSGMAFWEEVDRHWNRGRLT